MLLLVPPVGERKSAIKKNIRWPYLGPGARPDCRCWTRDLRRRIPTIPHGITAGCMPGLLAPERPVLLVVGSQFRRFPPA